MNKTHYEVISISGRYEHACGARRPSQPDEREPDGGLDRLAMGRPSPGRRAVFMYNPTVVRNERPLRS